MFEDGVREGKGAADLLACVSVLAALPAPVSEAESVDRIRALEELKAACAAAQARTTAALHGMRTEAEAEQGVPARERGRGLAAEVALARRESPNTGSRDLGLARALCEEMPHTLAALTRGAISEWKATIMCRETAWLSVEDRRQVDEVMADQLEELGVKKLAGVARAHAQRLDQASAVEQMNRSVRERRVSVRPAPGGMAYLTALLPMAQAVGCLARLKKSAATTVGTGARAERTQDQVMADLLVERLTGQAKAEDVPVEVHLVMTDRSLWGGSGPDAPGRDQAAEGPAVEGAASGDQPVPDQTEPDQTGGSEIPAWLVGHGPLPAGVARRVIADSEAEVYIRRLYTDPASGQLVAMDSKRRTFSGALRQLILVRDDTCRTPYCDAPVKHVDHVTPYRDGGPTSASNASGLCARCNYSKEDPAWSHASDGDRLAVTTPTGHRYAARTGPLVAGAPPGTLSGRLTVPSTDRQPDVPRSQPDPVLGEVTYRPVDSVLERGLVQLLMAAAVTRRAAVGTPAPLCQLPRSAARP
ncbi:DUF222 domain-containing protein [Citricoccus sp. NPDC055426]|uniref:HNH endonuclease n=1 Tax=Citricoccus sp. NPDC055426 TaxID=3155536 RepID=UPI00342AE7FA